MAVWNTQGKIQSGGNKAPVEPSVSAALNNIPPVIMSNNLAHFHNKSKVTFVACQMCWQNKLRKAAWRLEVLWTVLKEEQ